MTCKHCGQPVTPCLDQADGCTVRCLHDHPTTPDGPPMSTWPVPCRGWQHLGGWHMCDPAVSHEVLAEAIAS